MRNYYFFLIDKYETCPKNNFNCQINALEEALEIISLKENKNFLRTQTCRNLYKI